MASVIALAFVPSASAEGTEIQHPDERIVLSLHGKRGFDIYALLYPSRHVAVFEILKGRPEPRTGRSLGAAYAVHVPTEAFQDGMKINFGRLGSIAGHFVPSGVPRILHQDPACKGPKPESEEGQFKGLISFKGAGYLTVRAHRAKMYVGRSFKLQCRHGHAINPHNPTPGLFGYIEPPTRTFSNSDGTVLVSTVLSRTRLTEFTALHHLYRSDSAFRASALEWLPGEVATTRWVEMNGAAVSNFAIDTPKLHPASATVEPPSPFAGQATYSRKSHALKGDLSVSLLGLEVSLVGKRSRAGLCVFTRDMLDRICE